MDTHTYVVRDGAKHLTFEGALLAHISSRRPSSPRWTEMSLYRTAGGTYVYEKIGRSRVVHMPGCNKLVQPLPRFQDIRPGEDPDAGYEFCSCVPDEYDFTQLLSEEDRCSVIVSEDVNGIVESLYRKKAGARELPQMVVSLLEQGCLEDEDLRNSLAVEQHID